MASFVGGYPLSSNSVGPFPYNIDPQWNDLFLPINTARHPGSQNPTETAFTTNLSQYTFAVNDYVDLAGQEVLHGYKEGTDLELHLHLCTNGTEVVDTKARYVIYYSWANVNGTFSEASATGEVTIPANTADRTHLYLDMGDITGTNKTIGSQLCLRVQRIAKTADGNNPAANPFLLQVGIHYQLDSLGSTSETTK
jgi:hypothetical protein